MERLLCLEEGVDVVQSAPKRAFRHETLLNDRRVLRNLLAKEDAYMPSGSYFVFQEEIRPYMRTVLTKWMLDVRYLAYSIFLIVTLAIYAHSWLICMQTRPGFYLDWKMLIIIT